MTDPRYQAFEDALIADMRAHDGTVTTGPLAGHPLMVVTSRGAKTGHLRRAILTYTRDAGDYVVAGTAAGSPTTPGWVHNITAEPRITVEVGNRTYDATATVVDDAERGRLWERHVAALPHFGEYPEKAGRVIPMVRITLAGGS